jgi:hypothetical protein
VIERSTTLNPVQWEPLSTNAQRSAAIPLSAPAAFLRIRGSE